MSRGPRPSTTAPPVPRARVDPIGNPRAALAVVGLLAARPRRNETILMVLDRRWRGELVIVVDGSEPEVGAPHEPVVEPLVDAVEVGTLAALDVLGSDALGLVVASVRTARGVRPGDAETWSTISAQAHQHGLVLVEWFVVAAGGIYCPRDLVGDVPRWPR